MMRVKKLVLIGLAALVVSGLTAWKLRQKYQSRLPTPPPAIEELPDALIVYCFHGNTRDKKCKNIERWTHGVLEKSFAAPLKEGKIQWRVVNYETPENAHYKNDYQVSASSIVLVDARADRERLAKNLQHRVGQLAEKKKEFHSFMLDEMKNILK